MTNTNVNVLAVGEIDSNLAQKKIKSTRRSREEVLNNAIAKIEKSGKTEGLNLLAVHKKAINLTEGYRNKIIQLADTL